MIGVNLRKIRFDDAMEDMMMGINSALEEVALLFDHTTDRCFLVHGGQPTFGWWKK